MNLHLKGTWDDFDKDAAAADKGIILFGASSCADTFLNKLKKNYQVKYIIDNDTQKQGRKYQDKYDIFSPDKLAAESGGVLLITSTYYDEIIKQLEELDFSGTVYSFLHLSNKAQSDIDFDAFAPELSKLKAMLFDEKSREIVDAIWQKRIDNCKDYNDICEPKQYFYDGIIKKDSEAVFVDGGAFDGNTVRQFIAFQNNVYKKVYSFEMDKTNFDAIPTDEFDDRVTFLNYGLWNERKTISFITHKQGSEISDDGNSVAECVALDEVIDATENVTFIKMDIEGAEQNALLGAKNIIKRSKPSLAICLYHKFADLWEIPFMIHEMVPEYKFYIRHHNHNYEETVLYAVL